MSNMTRWEHFKKNYIWASVILSTMFVVSLIMSIVRDDIWQFSFFFLFLIVVLVIGNHFSWKKKFGGKS